MNFQDPYQGKSAEELTLYHATRRVLEGDAMIPINERTINGKKQKYLFATPYLSKTLQFAFDWTAREAIIGGAVDGSLDQFVIVCERSKTMHKDFHLYIYSFTGNDLGFYKTVTGSPYFKSGHIPDLDTREFCTTGTIPIARMNIHEELSDHNELMARGLQIFSTEKTYDQLIAENFLGDFYLHTPSDEWLATIVRDGFVWENDARQINPATVLKRKFSS